MLVFSIRHDHLIKKGGQFVSILYIMHFQSIINISSIKSCFASIGVVLYGVGLFNNLPRNCHSIYTKAKEPIVDRWAGCQGTTNLPDHEISSFLFTQSFFHMLRRLHHCVCWFGGCFLLA